MLRLAWYTCTDKEYPCDIDFKVIVDVGFETPDVNYCPYCGGTAGILLRDAYSIDVTPPTGFRKWYSYSLTRLTCYLLKKAAKV